MTQLASGVRSVATVVSPLIPLIRYQLKVLRTCKQNLHFKQQEFSNDSCQFIHDIGCEKLDIIHIQNKISI